MYRFIIRRFIVATTPLKSLGSLKSFRLLSTSSENKQKPVIAFFENYGFSKPQISVIVKKLPHLFSRKPEKILLPKLLFLQSKGISSSEVAKLVTSYPYILERSLNKRIIPSFDYYQDLLQSEEKAIEVIKRYVGLLYCDLRRSVRPNIEILRQIGVPLNNIRTVLRFQPRIFSINPIWFKRTIEEVKEMGVNPLHANFVRAVSVVMSINKSTWKKKVEVYRKWGWSEEQVLSAFSKHAGCMVASVDKINGVMDYFVNKIECESSLIARNPIFVALSLKRRTIPRGSVYLVLLSKGLIKKHTYVFCAFRSSEKIFLDKFIKPHEKNIPGLLKLYHESFL